MVHGAGDGDGLGGSAGAGGHPPGGSEGASPASRNVRVTVACLALIYWAILLAVDLLSKDVEVPLWLDAVGVVVLGYILGVELLTALGGALGKRA